MPAAALKEENSSIIASLTPELKETLHQSLLHYLQRNGFSKTLKRFQSEAQIQSDAWKASSLHLEDIFCKYNASNVDSNLNNNKKPGNEETTKKENEIATNEETNTKKKTKRGVIAAKDELKPSTTNENEVIAEVEKKDKKKKKKKSKSDSANEDDQVKAVKEETEKETVQVDASKEDKKSSKKRKRSLADENENENEKETTIAEESKSQKKETSNEEANVKVEINGGEKSGGQNSSKRQRKDSTEPKTVNAFQRVKIDQVEFAHEKLQDNSYWAKDGADIGYGAKAQEVLGQVRGRDFRHEKTKKKRGSYRGGLIDLQSHSIKFNYSDEE